MTTTAQLTASYRYSHPNAAVNSDEPSSPTHRSESPLPQGAAAAGVASVRSGETSTDDRKQTHDFAAVRHSNYTTALESPHNQKRQDKILELYTEACALLGLLHPSNPAPTVTQLHHVANKVNTQYRLKGRFLGTGFAFSAVVCYGIALGIADNLPKCTEEHYGPNRITICTLEALAALNALIGAGYHFRWNLTRVISTELPQPVTTGLHIGMQQGDALQQVPSPIDLERFRARIAKASSWHFPFLPPYALLVRKVLLFLAEDAMKQPLPPSRGTESTEGLLAQHDTVERCLKLSSMVAKSNVIALFFLGMGAVSSSLMVYRDLTLLQCSVMTNPDDDPKQVLLEENITMIAILSISLGLLLLANAKALYTLIPRVTEDHPV